MLFMGYVTCVYHSWYVCILINLVYGIFIGHLVVPFVRIQRYILCHYYRKWMVVLWWEFLSACNPVYSNSNPGGYGTFFELWTGLFNTGREGLTIWMPMCVQSCRSINYTWVSLLFFCFTSSNLWGVIGKAVFFQLEETAGAQYGPGWPGLGWTFAELINPQGCHMTVSKVPRALTVLGGTSNYHYEHYELTIINVMVHNWVNS